MERGPLLKTVTSLPFPFILVIALYLLLSGHNRAGGGFIAGVLVSGAIALQYLAHGFHQVPTFLRLPTDSSLAWTPPLRRGGIRAHPLGIPLPDQLSRLGQRAGSRFQNGVLPGPGL